MRGLREHALLTRLAQHTKATSKREELKVERESNDSVISVLLESPNSVVPSVPPHAKNGTFMEMDGSFGYSLAGINQA